MRPPQVEVTFCKLSINGNYFVVNMLPTQRLSSQVGLQARKSSIAQPVEPVMNGTRGKNPVHMDWFRFGGASSNCATVKAEGKISAGWGQIVPTNFKGRVQ
jgi:hypothetical protein